MADKKISQLDPIDAAIGTDLLVVVDDPSGTAVTKKTTVGALLTIVDVTAKTLSVGSVFAQTDANYPGGGTITVKGHTTEPLYSGVMQWLTGNGSLAGTIKATPPYGGIDITTPANRLLIEQSFSGIVNRVMLGPAHPQLRIESDTSSIRLKTSVGNVVTIANGSIAGGWNGLTFLEGADPFTYIAGISGYGYQLDWRVADTLTEFCVRNNATSLPIDARFKNLYLTGGGNAAHVDLREGVPFDPLPDTARLYALDVNGYTQVEMRDGSAKVVRLASDNVLIAKVSEPAGVPRGAGVYLDGAVGANPLVRLARADSISTMPCIGLALDAGVLNGFIRVLLSGTLALLNTSAFAEGAALFVSSTTAGGFTPTLPVAPAYAQRIGFITRSHATTGEMLVLTTGVVTPPRLHADTHAPGGTDPLVNAAWLDVAQTFSAIQSMGQPLQMNSGVIRTNTDAGFLRLTGSTTENDRAHGSYLNLYANGISPNGTVVIGAGNTAGSGIAFMGAAGGYLLAIDGANGQTSVLGSAAAQLRLSSPNAAGSYLQWDISGTPYGYIGNANTLASAATTDLAVRTGGSLYLLSDTNLVKSPSIAAATDAGFPNVFIDAATGLLKRSTSQPVETTWTPILGGMSGTSGQSYNQQTGQVLKIGRWVIAAFYIAFSNKGTITGNCMIGNLPYAPSTGTLSEGAFANYCLFDSLATNWITIHCYPSPGATYAPLRGLKAAGTSNNAGGGAGALVTGDLTNSTFITGVLIYMTN